MRVENSFIPIRGIGETTERRLWRQGITEWDVFEPTVLGPKTGDRAQAYINNARDRLAMGDAPFFAKTFPDRCHWRLYETFRSTACFLDIETTGLDKCTHEVTVVTTHLDGNTTTLVKDANLTRDRLLGELNSASLLVTFNGKRFDVPFLESAFDLSIDLPHLDLLYPCRRIGLTGGLKTIEGILDIDRDKDDLSGRDAVRLWHAHERGEDGALETLVEYNQDDTVNLQSVADTVIDRLHREIFTEVVGNRQTQLHHQDW